MRKIETKHSPAHTHFGKLCEDLVFRQFCWTGTNVVFSIKGTSLCEIDAFYTSCDVAYIVECKTHAQYHHFFSFEKKAQIFKETFPDICACVYILATLKLPNLIPDNFQKVSSLDEVFNTHKLNYAWELKKN